MWEHSLHLIASSVPVEPAGGDASQTEKKEEEEKEASSLPREGQISVTSFSEDQFWYFIFLSGFVNTNQFVCLTSPFPAIQTNYRTHPQLADSACFHTELRLAVFFFQTGKLKKLSLSSERLDVVLG